MGEYAELLMKCAEAQAEVARLTAERDAIRAEGERAGIERAAKDRAYAEFGSWCFEQFWNDGEPCDIDGGDAQEAAVRLGLLGRTAEHDAGVTHAEDCEWQPGMATAYCCCFVPLRAPLRALAAEAADGS